MVAVSKLDAGIQSFFDPLVHGGAQWGMQQSVALYEALAPRPERAASCSGLRYL